MTHPINPVDVENSIKGLVEEIARGVRPVSDAEERARTASRRLDIAMAHAYMTHNGPAHEKKYAAVLATERQRIDYDAADLAYRHAEREQKAREAQLRGWQSLGASVREMYGAQR